MSDLDDLYQEVILDHNKNPRNFGEMQGADRIQIGHNPLCGDKLTVFLKLDGDVVREVRFMGSGCAISKASASVMTETLKGKSRAEAVELFGKFHDMVTKGVGEDVDLLELGEIGALAGVSKFPVRVKCASLAWQTVKAALDESDETVSTE